MKKILKSLLFIAVFIVSGFVGQNVYAQECTVESASFSQITGNKLVDGPNTTNLKIESNGCENGLNIQLKSLDYNKNENNHRIDFLPTLLLPDSSGKLEIKLEVDDDTCFTENKDVWGYNCIAYIEIYNNKGQIRYSGKTSNIKLDSTYIKNLVPKTTGYDSQDLLDIAFKKEKEELEKQRNRGVLIGNCSDNLCFEGDINKNNSQNWDLEKVLIGSKPDASGCILGKDDVYFSSFGDYITNSLVRLNINAEKCINSRLNVELRAVFIGHPVYDIINFIIDGDNRVNISNRDLDYIKILVKEKNVSLSYKAADEECGSWSSPNCLIYVKIWDGENNVLYTSEEKLKKIQKELVNVKKDVANKIINDNNHKEGILLKNCDKYHCTGEDWQFKYLKGASEVKIDGSIENSDPENIPPEKYIDTESPCFENGEKNPNCYEFLAPIPGIEKNDPNITKDGSRIAITNLKSYQLGDYINTLFQLAVSLLAIISVIMIVVAGVQYMTVESIYGKSDAKQRIIGAVSGLILALGIYIILWTINPKLLEVNLGDGIKIVSINVDGEAIRNNDGSYSNSSGKTITVQGKKIIYGTIWPPEKSTLLPIRDTVAKMGISINNPECKKVGDKGCTSTYFDVQTQGKLISQLATLKAKCNCDFQITGGSEVWVHQTHSVSEAILDLSIKAKPGKTTADDIKKLNKALSGDKYMDFNDMVDKEDWVFGTEKQYIPGIRAYAEKTGSAPHWHIRF